MAKNKNAKIISKKHLDRLHRERRQTRAIIGVAIGIIALVILLIGYGILDQTVLQLRRPALTVNGDSISMREFQVRVRAQRQLLIDQYMQYYQFAAMLGVDPTSDPSLSQYLNQISSQLDTASTVASQVMLDTRDAILIRQFAEANGIAASADEIEQAVHEAYGYYPEGSPTPSLTPTTLAYSTLSSTQISLMTPTVTVTPAPTRTRAPTATLDLSATPTTAPSATSISSPTPSATPYTLDGFQGQYQQGLEYYTKLGMNEADYRTIYFADRLNRQHVMDMVTADVPHSQDQVWARHILVTDEATAIIVRDQLLAGRDFAEMASLYSIDTGNKDKGGDLGWFGPGKMVAEFETAAYGLKIGEISQPVQTTYGFHIIQVLGHEVRPLTDTEYQDAVKAAFDTWLQAQRDAADVVFSDNWVKFIPTGPTLQEAFNNVFATQTALAPLYQSEQETAQALYPTPTP